MNELASPILLFAASVVGAIGIAMALPRRGVSPQLLGALIAGLGLGGMFLALGLRSPGNLPNINFYIFSVIALGSALRVISHPRPVYAALYFILTILASAGLYVLLSAEFMAFALVIVYAGAILITYLFVLMLATESPTADQVEALSEYDRYSREPVVATVTAFILVAALTAMIGLGTTKLGPAGVYASGARVAQLPGKVEAALVEAKLLDPSSERLARRAAAPGQPVDSGPFMIAVENGRITAVTIAYGQGQTHTVTSDHPRWPKDLVLTNVEGVGFALLADHPGGIEVAGIVLLMAMLGAVVLARKKVDMDDAAKLAAQQHALVDEQSMAARRTTPGVSTPHAIMEPTGGIGGNGSNGTGRSGSRPAAGVGGVGGTR